MILGREEIHNRLSNGEIFRKPTWDDQCLREASYVLRIADDGLLLDGKFYDPFDRKNRYEGDYIVIAPGKIAILSTMEELIMPPDLVGKIGIRLDFALLGLTGLMGIQVDPLYGHDKEHERLYVRVANFGNEPIRLLPGDGVFTFELHQVAGNVPTEPKKDSWPRIKQTLKDLDDASWSYVTRVESNLSAETQNVKDYFQPLVMFGVFLVAVSILGAAIAVLLRTPQLDEVVRSSWLDVDEQNVLLWVLLVGIAGTAWVGLAAGWRFLRPYRSGTPRATTGWIRKCWRISWHWLW